MRPFAEKYEREFEEKSDHNGIKGYTAMYVVKAVTEKIGKFGQQMIENIDVVPPPFVFLDRTGAVPGERQDQLADLLRLSR
jgi:hypothetical protein